MIAASWPRDDARSTRLLRVDPGEETLADGTIGALPEILRAGDVLVVNDAATLPASLPGTTDDGAPIEVRLAGPVADADGRASCRAVLFGAGDWRTRTEDRPAPPRLEAGAHLQLRGLSATITRVDAQSARLVELAFDRAGGALWRALYRAGHPVQYAYVARPLALWHVQTAFASRPWAAEAPSAGFAIGWELLVALRRRGVTIARVTHAAGLSSTGDEALDARLPLAERFEVPAETVAAVESARARGGRVIAVGTTVARALEGAAALHGGRLLAGEGATTLLLGPDTRPRVVDGLVTGVHEADTSHFRLLEAFAPRRLLERAHALAEARGYHGHELGDAMLVLAG